MATINFAPLVPQSITALTPASPLPQTVVPGQPLAVPFVATDADGVPLPSSTPLPASHPAAALNEAAAMRPDQVFMARQLAWPGFTGATLAAAWRGMLSAHGAQLAALQQQSQGQHVPGALLMAGQYPSAAATQQPLAPLQWHPDAWRFVLPDNAGRQLTLRLLSGGPDQPPGRRRRGKAALRVELTLADGSRAMVQLEPVADGVMLELAAAQPHAVEQLRSALPALREAIKLAGLTLVRASIGQSLGPGRPLQDYPALPASALPPALFRAMAEVALLLVSQPFR
jgi:hypothetical protein